MQSENIGYCMTAAAMMIGLITDTVMDGGGTHLRVAN